MARGAQEVTEALRRFDLLSDIDSLQQGMLALIQERVGMQQKLKLKEAEVRKLDEMAAIQELALNQAQTDISHLTSALAISKQHAQALEQELNSAQARGEEVEAAQSKTLTMLKSTVEADLRLQELVHELERDKAALQQAQQDQQMQAQQDLDKKNATIEQMSHQLFQV